MAKKVAKKSTRKFNFDKSQFTNINELKFAPTWIPEDEEESVAFLLTGVNTIEQKKGKGKKAITGDTGVIYGTLIDHMGAKFFTGKKKHEVTVEPEEDIAMFISAAFVGEADSKRLVYLDERAGKYKLTAFGEYVKSSGAPVWVCYQGMTKTGNGRKFKSFEVNIPTEVVEEYEKQAF